jgi:hypothetical protein
VVPDPEAPATREPVLPDRAREDTDEGWGDPRHDDPQAGHEDWLRRQRPPHH